MSRKLTAVPAIPAGVGAAGPVLQALKDGVDFLTGQRNNRILPLASTASNAEIIAKINELVARLNPNA